MLRPPPLPQRALIVGGDIFAWILGGDKFDLYVKGVGASATLF